LSFILCGNRHLFLVRNKLSPISPLNKFLSELFEFFSVNNYQISWRPFNPKIETKLNRRLWLALVHCPNTFKLLLTTQIVTIMPPRRYVNFDAVEVKSVRNISSAPARKWLASHMNCIHQISDRGGCHEVSERIICYGEGFKFVYKVSFNILVRFGRFHNSKFNKLF